MGVYSAAGRQVLAGSERTPERFLLFRPIRDFRAKRMAKAPEIPFSQFIVQPISSMAKLSRIRGARRARDTAYAEHPGAFLVQLFHALHVQFSGDPTISPLGSARLLLLDTVVAPNGTSPARTAATGKLTAGAARPA